MNPNLSISGTELLLAVSLITLLIIALIVVGRYVMVRRMESHLAKKDHDAKWDVAVSSQRKYPDVDVLGQSGLFQRIGMVVSLALLVLAFNWTSYEKQVEIPEGALDLHTDLEIEPPRSAAEPPPPPPPPPPVIEEVPNEMVLEAEDEFEFVDQSVSAESAVDMPAPKPVREKADVPPPPPPPPMEPTVEEIFKVVEEMPRFPGCEGLEASMAEKKACADKKMLEFLYENLRYPAIARENNISGTVVVQFVVEVDGTITDARVVRDIGGTCGEEALRVVQLMNKMPDKWTPGRQRGRAVRVMFSLPVKFVLKET